MSVVIEPVSADFYHEADSLWGNRVAGDRDRYDDAAPDDLRSWPDHSRAGGVTMTELELGDDEDDGGGDFAAVAYREENYWDVYQLPMALTQDFKGVLHALRQQPSISGSIGLLAIGDDFFVLVRVYGDDVSVFLSDVTASVDWQLARDVLEHLDIDVPDDEDLDQVLPAGDMSVLADLGLDEMELGALAGDLDLYPDEVLASIAERIGFQQAFQRAVDTMG
ncbi:hypothetical protein EKD16_24810 [Streptomonospora litoralis]|uniref:tRNA adenosine deaminase n=2 Tax=Streptomonospora litoralis TaxID=2498135 RepID=A0A4P6Q7L6_9ACTN|nr:hypothetical protein EKD16_24810 [Streptomonospora litoralis]